MVGNRQLKAEIKRLRREVEEAHREAAYENERADWAFVKLEVESNNRINFETTLQAIAAVSASSLERKEQLPDFDAAPRYRAALEEIRDFNAEGTFVNVLKAKAAAALNPES